MSNKKYIEDLNDKTNEELELEEHAIIQMWIINNEILKSCIEKDDKIWIEKCVKVQEEVKEKLIAIIKLK